ncbi:hypothetical protein JL721_7522 [Aureococcus anophagefferens]|nr:hypothetical protein JL721_7522 [Aureococcus anophagefferens]
MTSEKAALVDDVEAGGRGGGDATFGMTVITLMKICVGTGVLAVPHAFSGAGVVPGFGMLFALLCWNDWSANRLLACRDLLSDDERRRCEAPGGESPLGALARFVAGPRVATAGAGVDTFAAACLALPLSLVDDIGALAYAGAAGLCAIFVSFACIVTYGVEERTAVGWAQADGFTWMTPTSVSALASGFGVLAFCFGVAPLALQLEASMAEPRRFAAPSGTRWASRSRLRGDGRGRGVSTTASCAPDGVAGNVLDDLPRGAVGRRRRGAGRDVRGLRLRRPSAS